MITLQIQLDDADYLTLIDAMDTSQMSLPENSRRQHPALTGEQRILAHLETIIAGVIRGHRLITEREKIKETDVPAITFLKVEKV
jgi:hypothetical protein